MANKKQSFLEPQKQAKPCFAVLGKSWIFWDSEPCSLVPPNESLVKSGGDF